jgi:hypothetical protein
MLFTDTGSKLLEVNEQASAWVAGKRTKGAARKMLGLSKNSKMPSWTIAIPAREACPRGDKLAKIVGTICYGCYAAKSLDALPSAITAKHRRWDTIKLALENPNVREQWVQAMVISLEGEQYFRWHSSGDLFSDEYAMLVREVIERTPNTMHWIPTREAKYSKLFNQVNCAFRVSDDMVGQETNKYKGLTSGVHVGKLNRGQQCSAYETDGKCNDCRACWDKKVTHISYKLH